MQTLIIKVPLVGLIDVVDVMMDYICDFSCARLDGHWSVTADVKHLESSAIQRDLRCIQGITVIPGL